jgi:hypothetical protein
LEIRGTVTNGRSTHDRDVFWLDGVGELDNAFCAVLRRTLQYIPTLTDSSGKGCRR